MSSTNKTTNYELSQFLGSDKPAWLTDYNSDMGKIDAGIYTAQSTATGADGKADSNATAIGTLASLTTDAKTSAVAAINEVDAHADTAQNSANTAANTANQANTKAGQALTEVAKFDLDNEIELTVTSNLGTVYTNTLKIRKDTTNSVYKLYGQITVGSLDNATGSVTLTISPTSGLNPSTAYDVEGGALIVIDRTTGTSSTGMRKFNVATDGTISLPAEAIAGNVSGISWFLSPCVYFNKSFGD